MNVDELAHRGMLMLMHMRANFCVCTCVHNHVFVHLYVFTADREHTCSFPPLCDCVSVCRVVKVEDVGESNSRQASDGS